MPRARKQDRVHNIRVRRLKPEIPVCPPLPHEYGNRREHANILAREGFRLTCLAYALYAKSGHYAFCAKSDTCAATLTLRQSFHCR
jgi:hypothetical protein